MTEANASVILYINSKIIYLIRHGFIIVTRFWFNKTGNESFSALFIKDNSFNQGYKIRKIPPTRRDYKYTFSYFLALGFTRFLQSRVPWSRARISASAVAILVAKGTL